MKPRLFAAGSFVAGTLVGALVFAAAERHLRAPLAPAYQSTGAADIAKPGAAVGGQALDVSGVEKAPMPAVSDQSDRWETVDKALVLLSQRVTALETQLSEVTLAGPVEAEADTTVTAARNIDQDNLVAAGVDPGQATEILRRQNRLEMQRLELRDQASREGWLNSERFFKALRELEGGVKDLREEIGDDASDRFLFLTDQPNRVVIASVVKGLVGFVGHLVCDSRASDLYLYRVDTHISTTFL